MSAVSASLKESVQALRDAVAAARQLDLFQNPSREALRAAALEKKVAAISPEGATRIRQTIGDRLEKDPGEPYWPMYMRGAGRFGGDHGFFGRNVPEYRQWLQDWNWNPPVKKAEYESMRDWGKTYPYDVPEGLQGLFDRYSIEAPRNKPVERWIRSSPDDFISEYDRPQSYTLDPNFGSKWGGGTTTKLVLDTSKGIDVLPVPITGQSELLLPPDFPLEISGSGVMKSPGVGTHDYLQLSPRVKRYAEGGPVEEHGPLSGVADAIDWLHQKYSGAVEPGLDVLRKYGGLHGQLAAGMAGLVEGAIFPSEEGVRVLRLNRAPELFNDARPVRALTPDDSMEQPNWFSETIPMTPGKDLEGFVDLALAAPTLNPLVGAAYRGTKAIPRALKEGVLELGARGATSAPIVHPKELLDRLRNARTNMDDWKARGPLSAFMRSDPRLHMLEDPAEHHYKYGYFGQNHEDYPKVLDDLGWDPEITHNEYAGAGEWADDKFPNGLDSWFAKHQVPANKVDRLERVMFFDRNNPNGGFDPEWASPQSFTMSPNKVKFWMESQQPTHRKAVRTILNPNESTTVLPLPVGGESEFLLPPQPLEITGMGEDSAGHYMQLSPRVKRYASGGAVIEEGGALLKALKKLLKEHGIGSKAKTSQEALAELKAANVPGADVNAVRGILTSPDLRDMSFEQALKVARLQPHLFQDAAGQFTGAPRGLTSRQGLTNIRRSLDRDVGAGASGAHWYDRARDFNAEIAGPDPARQSQLAREEALWSAQADPDTNLNFALQGHNAYEMGTPRERVRTGQQASSYSESRNAGEEIPLGPKTEIYANHLDPTAEHSPVGTNDIWHARALGYTNTDGSTFSRGLNPQEHRFMDYETVLAADRANANTRGGFDDWTGDRAQAAAWVARKGASLAKKKDIPLEEGIALASKTYPDYVGKYTFNATHEQMPFVDSGHFPDLFKASSAQRDAYASDPRRMWGDENGRDEIYDALGLYQRPILPAHGMYTPPGGETEFNLAGVSRPLVGLRPAELGGMDDASRHAVELGEGWRALLDAQGAGAGHIHDTRAGIPIKRRNALQIPYEGESSSDLLQALAGVTQRHGMRDVSDTGHAFTTTTFGADPAGTQINRELRKSDLDQELQELIPGTVPKLTMVDSVYAPMYEQGTVPGSGELTRQMLDKTGDALLAKLDKSSKLRAKIGSKLAADAERAAVTGAPYRQDLQNLREIIADPTRGFSALRKALSDGVPLPAILLGGAGLEGYQLSDDDSGM